MPKLPHLPTSGTFSPAPAGAPHEVSSPLAKATVEAHLEQALLHEKSLKPLVFEKVVVTSRIPSPEEGPKALPSTGPAMDEGHPAKPEIPSIEAQAQSSEPPVEVPQPAASDTDTPSHGMPKPIPDPGKHITGGFGEQGQSYFALDGAELRECIREQFDRLNAQLQQDLHFSIACAYPQVRVKVSITVDGASADAAINDVKFDLASARLYQASTLIADTNTTPADALRVDAALPRPQKQRVRLGGGHQLVDVT